MVTYSLGKFGKRIRLDRRCRTPVGLGKGRDKFRCREKSGSGLDGLTTVCSLWRVKKLYGGYQKSQGSCC